MESYMKNRNLFESFKTAFQGIWYTFVNERNMKIHLAAAAFIILLSLWLGVSKIEMTVLCLTIAMVICFELINTAMEVMVNIIVDVYHPKAKIIKDVSAGAVFVSALFSIVIGGIILADKLINKLMIFYNVLK
jgi:diacylglycerol kinase (ATP)